MKKQQLWLTAVIFFYGNASQFVVRRRSHPIGDFTRTEYRRECEDVFNQFFLLEQERNRLSLDNADLRQKVFNAMQKVEEFDMQNKDLRSTMARLKTNIIQLKSENARVKGELKVEQQANQCLKVQSRDAFSNWLFAQHAEEREKTLVRHIAEIQRAKKLKEEMFNRWKNKYLKRSHL